MAFTDQRIVSDMEPQVLGLPPDIAAAMSTAISLKRIADFLCGHKDKEGIDHMDFVQYIGREIESQMRK